MSTTNQIRSQFLNFFKERDHVVMPSSPLVPHNDPTLMFTNAGMNQFKNVFTGAEAAPEPPRATTAQKCVRAGGKHNDLDNVGYTARHHTFFEMMGNFSFGDYFKEGAIVNAWELLTKEFGLPKDKLFLTVYHTDDEAFDLWKKVTGFGDERILRVPTKDNFWAMGDTGPCGPCSEVFYDHGADAAEGEWKLDANGSDMFGDRFIEIWNLVFMQFETLVTGEQTELPKPSIDTGMGLERMVAVLQGKHNNYDIDLFLKLITAIKEASGSDNEAEHLASYRVIADHLRSSSFLMADGVLPSNEGRGYVLRRIMRRAMRHAHMIGCKDTLMHQLVPSLVAEMGDAYPELKRAQSLITENLKLEEERFKQTLDRGLKLLEEERAGLNAGGQLSGDVAFKLYDTYGFPLDLTQDILRADNMDVDIAGFDAAMAEQKERARAAWSGSGDAGTSALWFDLKDKLGATEFLGYTETAAQGKIVAIVQGDKQVDSLKEGDSGYIITNQTPFYGEGGGQVGDSGKIYHGNDHQAMVTDTIKPLEDFIVHRVEMLEGTLKKGDEATLVIDAERRDAIRANHSATHIVHAVLRRFLGDHVTQKGSLVDEEKLRFDISHPKQITLEELQAVEQEVNRIIWQNDEVQTKLMKPDDAIEAGAVALFGEKYGDEVRVLSMGRNDDTSHYSVELCGGTHVSRTGDIGLFKITGESAVAAGIRRIEAVTQRGAFAYLSERDTAVRMLASELKSKPDELEDAIQKLLADKKKLEKELAETKKKLALGGAGGGAGDMSPEPLGDKQFIGKAFDELPPKELRELVNSLIAKHANTVVALASAYEGKASIIVAGSKDMDGRINAPELVQLASQIVGGKGGGGKPNFAQAGGADTSKIADAVEGIKAKLQAA